MQPACDALDPIVEGIWRIRSFASLNHQWPHTAFAWLHAVDSFCKLYVSLGHCEEVSVSA
jgi:hypothetical protein